MKYPIKGALAGGVVALSLFGAAAAGPFDDGVVAAKHGDYAVALRLWRPLADQGDAKAQLGLGTIYAGGQGVPQNNALAVDWYRKAADQGSVIAQFNLGVMYAKGLGVAQDYASALAWYGKAAAQGYAAAQYNLGAMYVSGQGVVQDYASALAWFRKAAAQGYAAAQYNLGAMYVSGQGVPPDYVQAYVWFDLAASRFPAEDAEMQSKVVIARQVAAAHLTAAQLVEAQHLAKTSGQSEVAGAYGETEGVQPSASFAGVSASALAGAVNRADSARVPLSAGAPTQALIQRTEAAIADTLKDPESARFSDVRVLPGPRPYSGYGSDGRYGDLARLPTLVCGYVNAKNSYGGYEGKEPFVAGWRGAELVLELAEGGDDVGTEYVFIQPIAKLCGGA